jgi:hypothetical protein
VVLADWSASCSNVKMSEVREGRLLFCEHCNNCFGGTVKGLKVAV